MSDQQLCVGYVKMCSLLQVIYMQRNILSGIADAWFVLETSRIRKFVIHTMDELYYM